jgi:starvation-inducible outer membrane lipoprotein
MTNEKERNAMKINVLTAIVATAGLALAGCAATPLEADYGTSFRQMSTGQVYDPATLAQPSAARVEGADPDVIELAVKTMRTEKTERSKVAQPLVINIGGQSGQ